MSRQSAAAMSSMTAIIALPWDDAPTLHPYALTAPRSPSALSLCSSASASVESFATAPESQLPPRTSSRPTPSRPLPKHKSMYEISAPRAPTRYRPVTTYGVPDLPTPRSPPPPEPCQRTSDPLPDTPLGNGPRVEFPLPPDTMPHPSSSPGGGRARKRFSIMGLKPRDRRSGSPPDRLVPEVAVLALGMGDGGGEREREGEVGKKNRWLGTKASVKSLRIWKKREREEGWDMVS